MQIKTLHYGLKQFGVNLAGAIMLLLVFGKCPEGYLVIASVLSLFYRFCYYRLYCTFETKWVMSSSSCIVTI